MIGLVAGIGSALAGIAGSAISQSMANRQQDKVNEQNVALQREQWARDDTYNQRMVADMQKAGLNPLNGVSGTSSPLSASASAPQVMDFGQTLQNGFNSIMNGIQADNQMKLQNNQLKLQALSLGINPDKLLDPSQYDSIAKTYKDLYTNRALLAGAQAKDTQNAVDSGSNKYSSPFGKIFNEIKPKKLSSNSSNSSNSSSFDWKKPPKFAQKIYNYFEKRKAQSNYKKVQKAMGRH